MRYAVVFSKAAAQDLEQLFDFALQRELDSETGDRDIPATALPAIKEAIRLLENSPFACRKLGRNPFVRELVIPFGRVALFEIVDQHSVMVGAVRHQREDDGH